jgi:hypothetical protein
VHHDAVLAVHRRFFLPHSSASSRFTAGAVGFFILSQSGEQPERYIESLRFDTMPSSPILQGVCAFQMLVEAEAKPNFGQHTSKRGLADLKRIMPQIVVIQFDKVERV